MFYRVSQYALAISLKIALCFKVSLNPLSALTEAPTSQNDQAHPNKSSATAEGLFECV